MGNPINNKLGVLIPGMGAVASTFICGVIACSKGLAKPIGSMTQMGSIRLGKRTENRSPIIKDFVPLSNMKDLVFGGWDINNENIYETSLKAKVLDKNLLDSIKPELEDIKPFKAVFDKNFVRRLSGEWIKTGLNKFELVKQLIDDIETFNKLSGAKSNVMIWCGSTEIHLELSKVHESLPAFEKGLKENDPEINKNESRRACLYPWERVVLTAKGTLNFCPTDWYGKSEVSDFAKTSIREVWKNNFYNDLRDQHLKNDYKNEFCKQCPDWKNTSWPFDKNKSYADYSYDVTSDVWSTETNDSTFELTADSEEISCSAGGGSTPSMWIGSMAGNGNTNANDFDGTDKADDFIAGGVGFNIPLGGKSNYSNCNKILAIVETEKFLKVVGELNSLGVIDETKMKSLIAKYLKTNESKFGTDIFGSLDLD